MEIKKMHMVGAIAGIITILADIFFFRNDTQGNLFFFLLGIGVMIMVLPFIVGIVIENKREQQINEMFLEFSRNLAESVTTGTPISKSIINMSKKQYGALTPYISKLGNQIALGIPVSQALNTFAHDVDNPVISRAVGLISEAEKAGGEIDYILDSVSKSIAEVEKLRKERKAAISSLIVQGYIIFFIFIGIMLIMEFKILPLTVQIGNIGGLGEAGSFDPTAGTLTASESAPIFTAEQLGSLFLYLLLAQGFFTGLVIGKLAEGTVRAGVKHSFIMMISAFLIITGTRIFLTPAIGA